MREEKRRETSGSSHRRRDGGESHAQLAHGARASRWPLWPANGVAPAPVLAFRCQCHVREPRAHPTEAMRVQQLAIHLWRGTQYNNGANGKVYVHVGMVA